MPCSAILFSKFKEPVKGADAITPLKGNTLIWAVQITSSTPLLGDSGTKLSFKIVDKATDERTEAFSVDSWDAPREITIDGIKGWCRSGTVNVPATLLAPSAILVQKQDSAKDSKSLDYITAVVLKR
eukprot:gene7334-7546_t